MLVDGKQVCQCFAEWIHSDEGGSEVCHVPSTNKKTKNCVHFDHTAESCTLCKPYYKLNITEGECHSEEGKDNACAHGCKFCDTAKCLVCDVGYAKKGATNDCELLTVDPSNQINYCKHHKTDAGCYQCETGYVTLADDSACELPAKFYMTKLRYCRKFGDTTKKTCVECLPEYTQIDKFGNSECVLGSKCQICQEGYWKSSVSDECINNTEDVRNRYDNCKLHYIKGGCYQC
jgi:hypothetical protein